MWWGFVGLVDTSETLNFTLPRFFVESFDIPLLTNGEGSVDEDFIKGEATCLVNFFGELSVLLFIWWWNIDQLNYTALFNISNHTIESIEHN